MKRVFVTNLQMNHKVNYKILLLGLFLFTTIQLFGQITVSGKITDKLDKFSITGVNILEKGTNNGTISDTGGYFTLQVANENSILKFSFLGYISQEIKVGELSYFNIKLKLDCIKDFFDYRDICVGLSSGVLNNPIGGFGYITFPFAHFSTIFSELDYQTNLSKNDKLNIRVGSLHLFSVCDYDGDLFFNYKTINKNEFASASYLLEGKLNFSRPRIFQNYSTLYFGGGFSNLSKTALNKYNSSGYLLGFGTMIGRPLYLNISIKSIYWTNYWEFKGELNRQFKNIMLDFDYNIIESYYEANIKIGYKFNY
jgi:hypothetical protein